MRSNEAVGVLVAGVVGVSTTAVADFTGLAVTYDPKVTGNATMFTVDVYRLYATFDSADDQVIAVGGTPAHPQVLESGDGFLQWTVFSTHQHLPLFDFGQDPMAYDSLLTIGVPQFYQGSPQLPVLTNFNVTDFVFGTGGVGFGAPVVVTPDGGWGTDATNPATFAVPFPPMNGTTDEGGDGTFCAVAAPPGATHAVQIAQLTVGSGEVLTGDLGTLSIRENGVPRVITSADPPGLDTLFSFQLECTLGFCCLAPDCVENVTAAACAAAGGVFLGNLGTDRECPYTVATAELVGPPQEWSHTIGPPVICPPETVPPCVGGPAKIDMWMTSGAANCMDFGAPTACAIPAGFFGPGSDPFFGVACFEGQPLGVVSLPGFPSLDFGDADMLVRRPADPFDRCADATTGQAEVEVKVEQLHLVGVSPISVTITGEEPQPWDVEMRVFSSASQPLAGAMTVTKDGCSGGTFDMTLNVCPTFVFRRVDPPFTELQWSYCTQCSIAGIPVSTTGVPWAHEADANSTIPNSVCSGFRPGVAHSDFPYIPCDCNGNNVRDRCDIDSGTSADCNGDLVPDECQLPWPCPPDLSRNCRADFADILAVIAAWGPCPPFSCRADIDQSGDVGFGDILAIIAGWGPC
ncbi:MAG: hypothetical protein GY715_22010 [Planctomycetes bacterium]|nr:hypothetical protein [Planctomycetota bacterium]